ncbi:hypothetical protein os4_23080 [Comamonadaceae bacterium OS-4]|nr:hypothetical protein os4_23080 [Comamonadaceae bacterium OS-4]
MEPISSIGLRRRIMLLASGASLLANSSVLASSGVIVGAAAPSFTVPDTSERPRTLQEFAGKTVVLEWTSPSCPFVRAQYEIGAMQAIQSEAAKLGVVWLSVLSTHRSRGDYLDAAKANEFNKTRGATPTALLMDVDGAMGRAYGARTTPHMFIIDPVGKVVYMGAIDDKPSYDAAVVKKSRNLVRAALADLAAHRPVATPISSPYGCAVGYA